MGYELEVPRKPRGNVSPVAEWVRAVRGKLTQNQFADQLDMDRTTVADWERDENEPEPPSVRRILARFPDAPPYPTKSDGPGVSDLDRAVPVHVELPASGGPEARMKPDAEYIAGRLNRIKDDLIRSEAAAKASEAINEVLRGHPRKPGAGKTTGRARTK